LRVHSSAPTRIDLAGGTLDIWPLYLFHENAQTLNAAITLRAECTLCESTDGRLHVLSEDTRTSVDVANWHELGDHSDLRLITCILRFFQVDGINITTRSGSPLGAGLAGSSALNIALCGALARWQGATYDAESLIQIALNLEAQVIGIPTGCQDYRPAMYGGLSALEMGPGGITRMPLTVEPHEIEARLVLAYTGESRDSSINNWEVTKRHLDRDAQITTLFDQIRDVAAGMRLALETRNWPEVGRHLDLDWELRKRLAPGVSTERIDTLVIRARRAGARAAKICGAGGGGCLILFADPPDVPAVKREISKAGATLLDYRIDPDGLRVVTE